MIKKSKKNNEIKSVSYFCCKKKQHRICFHMKNELISVFFSVVFFLFFDDHHLPISLMYHTPLLQSTFKQFLFLHSLKENIYNIYIMCIVLYNQNQQQNGMKIVYTILNGSFCMLTNHFLYRTKQWWIKYIFAKMIRKLLSQNFSLSLSLFPDYITALGRNTIIHNIK